MSATPRNAANFYFRFFSILIPFIFITVHYFRQYLGRRITFPLIPTIEAYHNQRVNHSR